MIGILATFNSSNSSWAFDADYGISNVPIYIGATGTEGAIAGARVGFTATQNGVAIGEYFFPPEGQTLISNDQPYICYTSLDIPSADDVSLLFFFERNGERHEEEYVLTPKTDPMPDDGGTYVWVYDRWQVQE